MAKPNPSYQPPELPEKYYLDYFNFILKYVNEKYKGMLIPFEDKFIKQFKRLSEDGKCLFLRMVLRRGVYFKKKTLEYQEISNLEAAVTELKRRKFIRQINVQSKDEFDDLLPLFIKKDLIQFAKKLNLILPSKSAKKQTIIDLVATSTKRKLLNVIAEEFTVFKQEKIEEVERMLFLFFGTQYRDISEFVVRDLGYRNFQEIQLEQLTPYFKTRAEIDQKWEVTLWRKSVYEDLDVERPIQEIFSELKSKIMAVTIDTFPAETALGRLLVKVGRELERSKHWEMALWAFQQTELPPSNEREIRVLSKMGERELAINACTILQEKTAHAEEYYFAKDFKNRLISKKNIKSTTQKQNESRSITIDIACKRQVELGALTYLVNEGYNGMFSENLLWNALFGILFWDIIFDDQQDAFHHPFQWSPSDWRTDHFYEKREKAIQNRLEIIFNKKALSEYIETTLKEKYGLANPMVYWYEELSEHLAIFQNCLSVTQLQRVLMEMARNPKSNTKGFPDLFLWKESNGWFVEVKSPNDKLSAQQLFWLDLFDAIGINSEVVNVKFK